MLSSTHSQIIVELDTVARNIDQWCHLTVDGQSLRAHHYGNNVTSNPLHYSNDVTQQLTEYISNGG